MARKIISTIVIFMLIVGLLPMTAYAMTDNPFNDIEGHWAKDLLIKKYKQGLVTGYPNGSFNPDGTLSRGELITIVNRCFGLSRVDKNTYNDVKSNDWYKTEADKAYYYQYVKENALRGQQPATRMEAVIMIGNLLDLEVDTTTGVFSDVGNLTKEEKLMLDMFAEMGYLKGDGDGTVQPDRILTRAEILTLVDNVLGYVVVTQEDVKTIPQTGRVTIIGQNITIEDKSIESLYISPGVNTKIIIKNTAIQNTIEIASEGPDGGVELINTSAEIIKVRPKANKLNLALKGDTKVNKITIENNGTIQAEKDVVIYDITVDEGVPTLEYVKVNNDLIIKGGTVNLTNTDVNDLIIRGKCEVKTDENTSIGNLEIEAETEIKGDGEIKKAYIKADGVTIETKPKYIKVTSGVKAEIAKQEITSKNDDNKSSKKKHHSKPVATPEMGTQVKLVDETWVLAQQEDSDTATGIWKIEDLAKVGTGKADSVWELSDQYVLMVDLDFKKDSDYRNPNDTSEDWDCDNRTDSAIKADFTPNGGNLGFKPLADIESMDFKAEDTPPFTGKFYGNDKTISHLYINRPTFSEDKTGEGGVTVGLFGGLMNATIQDLNLEDINITGANRIGGIAGGAMLSTISNCSVSGKAEGKAIPENAGDKDFVGKTTSTGGLLGMTYIKGVKVVNCSSSVDVKGTDAVGGLIGYNYGNPIKNSYATGQVQGDHFVGGLVGVNVGTMMMMPGNPPIVIHAEIENSYAAGSIKGINDIGGLVGYNHVYTNIKNSYAIGNVEGSNSNIGGLIGHNNVTGGVAGSVENCYATGSVFGLLSIGGLIGENRDAQGTIKNCIAFNENITGSSSTKRVIGNEFYHPSSQALSNNYAFDAMVVTASGYSLDKGLDKPDGKDIDGSMFRDISTYQDGGLAGLVDWLIFGEADAAWEIKENADRPTLINVGDDKGKI